MMKAKTILFAVIAVVCLCSILCTPVSGAAADTLTEGHAFDIWKSITASYPDRMVNTIGRDAVRDLIESAFISFGLTSFSYRSGDGWNVSTSRCLSFSRTVNEQVSTFYNVAGYKKSSVENAKTVIIGAHYDNLAGVIGNGEPFGSIADYIVNETGDTSSYTMSEGANKSAAGIAVLLSIADSLSDVELPFNLLFVAFDGEEMKLGSSDFINSISNSFKQEVMLYVNIDKFLCGDNLYYYTDEVKRSYDSLVEDAIATSGSHIIPSPADKRVAFNMSVAGLPYTHFGIDNSAAGFMEIGIPVLNFVGGDWTGGLYNESKTHKHLTGTADDTFDNIVAEYGESFVRARFAAVENTITALLTREGFITAMESARDEYTYGSLTDSTTMSIISWVIRIVIIGGLVGLFFLFKRKDALAEQPLPDEEIFGEDFGGKDDDNDKNNGAGTGTDGGSDSSDSSNQGTEDGFFDSFTDLGSTAFVIDRR